MPIPQTVLHKLETLVGKENLLTDEASLLLHAYDCSLSRTRPDAVVVIPNASVIPSVVTLLAAHKIPFVPRAAATNHAGSCAALKGGVILNLTRLNHILQIDTQHGFAWVEPGVITAQLQEALAPLGFFYAPDPASERICTIGGNAAQNASGARCMKYGGTLDHLLAAEVVLPSGKTIFLSRREGGPDLLGLLCGSEGTLGIITKLQVKILPQVEHIQTFLATFPSLQDCVQTVTDLVSLGITPRCVEAMDKLTAQAIEGFVQAGYPTEAESLLILELDGDLSQIKQDSQTLEKLCQRRGSLSFVTATTEERRHKLWVGRKAAYAAMARLAPNVMVGDGTVPRSELPTALQKVRKILDENKVYAGLLFHAGDGNFHPHLIFDERNKPETKRLNTALKQILQVCVDCGGTISGEHGIGVEKRAVMAYQYDKPTLDLFTKIKQATDPAGIANPLKIIPVNYGEKTRAPLSLSPSIEKLAEQLRLFIQAKTPYAVIGKNLQLKTTAPYTLSTCTLDKIIDIDLKNYTVTAEAGLPLDILQSALTARGVYNTLPTTRDTLGGAFSSGQFPHFYSQVLGIEALLPDGSYVRYGGKFTKNAAGYNLIRLFAGAQGKFGLVTKLTFKIFATPQPIPDAQPFQPLTLNSWGQALQQALDKHHLLVTEER